MADAARVQRQAALEEKKKRLDDLKARRQQRATTNLSSQDQIHAKTEASANLDDYIDGLLKAPAATSSVPVANHIAATSTGTTENGSKTTDETRTPAQASEVPTAPTLVSVASVPIVQPKSEMFEMGTQTAVDEFPESPSLEDGEAPQQQQSLEDFPKDANSPVNSSTEAAESLEVKVLTAEEVEKELSSAAFSSFLNSTSKKVERVLGSELLADLLIDYEGDSEGTKRGATRTSDGSTFLTSRQIYECPKWTASRDVTDMDWSPLHRELMLCGYHMRTSSSNLGQPLGSSATKVVSPADTPSDSLTPRTGELLSDGLALVWNLAMPNRPEHIFTCGSPVTTVRFHPTEATLIIGGCQSGQVVVWDVRGGRMPVQKSVLTTTATGNSKGHSHPICVMEVIEGGVS
jgi:dynein intermediate chain, cytosolic